MFQKSSFKMNKIFKSLLFFSFIFNILSANGFSYILFTQVANTIQTTTIFKIDNAQTVLVKTIKKDVKDMIKLNNGMLSIAGIVDGLFKTDEQNVIDVKKVELKTNKANDLVFSLFECFYIFSMSDFIFNFKVENKKDFVKFINKNKNIFKNSDFDMDKNIYVRIGFEEFIKHIFIMQNTMHNNKVYLDGIKIINI